MTVTGCQIGLSARHLPENAHQARAQLGRSNGDICMAIRIPRTRPSKDRYPWTIPHIPTSRVAPDGDMSQVNMPRIGDVVLMHATVRGKTPTPVVSVFVRDVIQDRGITSSGLLIARIRTVWDHERWTAFCDNSRI